MVAVTDRGRVRSHNEDCVGTHPEIGLAVLADGMGGHNAGEVASRMAVDVISHGMLEDVGAGAPLTPERARELIGRHILAANARIHEAGAESPDRAGMGTTVVVALWHSEGLSVGHVGDSRLYRLRAGRLEQLTRDHTLVQLYVDSGVMTLAAARRAPIRSVLTRAVGTEPELDVDVETFDVAAGDVYLLCSDGLTEMVSDDVIESVLCAPDAQARAAADELVRRANENGGVDNVSVILARIGGSGRPA